MSLFPSECEMSGMRAVIAQSWRDTVTHQRQSGGTSDGMGGTRGAGWSTVTTYTGQRVFSNASRESQGNRPAAVTSLKCLLPYDADVRPNDRLVIDAETFRVIETDSGGAGRVCLTAWLERVT